MRVTLKQLQRLSVETVSGVKLGKVHDLVLETDGQTIVQYVVKLSRLTRDEYVIGRDQVVRFESEKMLVDDAIKPVETTTERGQIQSANPAPVAMQGDML